MAASGLIALDIPWPFQPGFPVRPKEKWLARRLSFASKLSDVSNAVTGIPQPVTGTKAAGDYRGFGSTLGVGTTDIIQSPQVGAISTFRTYLIRYKRNGAGGGGFGRLMDRNDSATIVCESFAWGGSQITFQWNANGGVNDAWWFPATDAGGATAAKEYVIAFVYNPTTRAAAGYVNGARQVLTNSSVGSGTNNSLSTYALRIGNRSQGDRNWDGLLADAAVFDAELTPDEIGELSRPGGLWEDQRVLVQVPSTSTLPTLSASTYVPGSLSATGWRPQITAS